MTIFCFFVIGAVSLFAGKTWYDLSFGRKIQSGFVAVIAMLTVIAVIEATGMCK